MVRHICDIIISYFIATLFIITDDGNGTSSGSQSLPSTPLVTENSDSVEQGEDTGQLKEDSQCEATHRQSMLDMFVYVLRLVNNNHYYCRCKCKYSSTHERGITVHVGRTEIQYLYNDNYFYIQGKSERQQSLTRTFSPYLKNLRKKLMLEWKREKER